MRVKTGILAITGAVGVLVMAMGAGTGEDIRIRGITLTNGAAALAIDYPEDLGARLDVFARPRLGDHTAWRLADSNLVTAGARTLSWTNPVPPPSEQSFFVVGNADLDTDGDGLANARERYLHQTSENTPDSDGDGLVDGYSGVVPTNAYPGGAWTSGASHVEGELTWQTDPNRGDTDGDGRSDGGEVSNGGAPLAAEIDIGLRLEPFVDLFLVQSLNGTSHRFHRPAEIRNLSAPPTNGEHPTVIYDATRKRYRHYYRDTLPGYTGPGGDGNPGQVTAYEESTNGLHWTKPNLGLFEVNGSRSNNCILAGMPPFSHNFSPFLDTRPGCPAAQRYKALAGTATGSTGLVAFVSADGTNWVKLSAVPVLAPVQDTVMFDTQDVAFWSTNELRYVAYCRQVSNGVSSVVRATSGDFLAWSAYEPVPMNLAGEQIHASGAQPYFRAPHIMIGLASRSLPGMGETNEIVLWSSRAGTTGERLLEECYIRPPLGSPRWSADAMPVARNVFPLRNDTPEDMPDTWRYLFWENMAIMAGDRILRLTLDGFASINAPYQEGEMLTKPLIAAGSGLYLGYETSANGHIRVEIQDATGRPVPGFALADLKEDVRGNSRGQVVIWKQGAGISALAGRTIRLRFVMREADLYTIQFR